MSSWDAFVSADRLQYAALMTAAHTVPTILSFIFYSAVEASPELRRRYKIQASQHTNPLVDWLLNENSLSRTTSSSVSPTPVVKPTLSSSSSVSSSESQTLRHTNQPQKTSREAISRCVAQIIRSHCLIIPLLFTFPAFDISLKLSGHRALVSHPIGDVGTAVAQLAFYLIVEDALFYWFHRLLHWKPIYPYIHKQHHDFRSPMTLAAEYAHPVETLLGNFIPFLAGPVLWPSCTRLFALWMAIRMAKTAEAHSGFRFPWAPFSCVPWLMTTAERHDFHHSNNTGCYGSFFRFWDWMCGTDTFLVASSPSSSTT